jgi:hypothetical protein
LVQQFCCSLRVAMLMLIYCAVYDVWFMCVRTDKHTHTHTFELPEAMCSRMREDTPASPMLILWRCMLARIVFTSGHEPWVHARFSTVLYVPCARKHLFKSLVCFGIHICARSQTSAKNGVFFYVNSNRTACNKSYHNITLSGTSPHWGGGAHLCQ